MNNGQQTIYRPKYTFVAICQWKIRTSEGLYHKDKDKDQINKDKARTRINITAFKNNLAYPILLRIMRR